jgi:hypothetical protein
MGGTIVSAIRVCNDSGAIKDDDDVHLQFGYRFYFLLSPTACQPRSYT